MNKPIPFEAKISTINREPYEYKVLDATFY